MAKPKPCSDCGERAKELPRHFCAWCLLKREPMHVQAEAARRRLAAVPEHLRVKRSQKVIRDSTPSGTAFCGGCQSYCPEWMFASGATQCRPCMSIKQHERMTEKTYGISGDEYARILKVQGGRCAICRNAPKTTRLAVDHRHGDGAVRGLLCSRCNHELLGAAHDEPRALWNAFVYLASPPADMSGGSWEEVLQAHSMPDLAAPEPVAERKSPSTPFSLPSRNVSSKAESVPFEPENVPCEREHFLPVGSKAIPGKNGVFYVYVSDDPDADPPY